MDLKEYKQKLHEGLTHWSQAAQCKDMGPALFYSQDERDILIAKSVCRQCTVRLDCLEYALGVKEYGVWGGYDEVERSRLRRKAIRYRDLPIPESIRALAQDS